MHQLGQDPSMDWPFMLIGSVVFGLLLIIIGILAYTGINFHISNASNPSQNNDAVKARIFDKVLNDFGSRSSEYSSAVNSYSGPGDPSI